MSMSLNQFSNHDGHNDSKASIAFLFLIIVLVVIYSIIY